MHVRWSSRQFSYYLFILILRLTMTMATNRIVPYHTDVSRKCCQPGYLFNESLMCVERIDENELEDETSERSVDRLIVIEEVEVTAIVCYNYSGHETIANPSVVLYKTEEQDNEEVLRSNHPATLQLCIEDTTNGTKVVAKCTELLTRGPGQQSQPLLPPYATTEETIALKCSSLGTVVFWGAQTYMTANMAHVVLCIVVVAIYLSVPELGRGLYNRAVLRHNVCLMMHGCVLTLLGFCDCDHCQIFDELNVFLWIVMQFFTNATVFWLNVICFDMTLAITRFRWMPASSGHQRNGPEENHKLFLYSTFAWGAAFIPALVAAICEYVPGVPKTFVLKPNYIDYHSGRSVTVSMYFFALPFFTLLLNNILFLYTTYKIVRIQRSVEIATSNQTNILKKKYFLFLRLYLLMGAPWFYGALLAWLNNLVVLKMCRLIQPILWLLILVTHTNLRAKIVEKIQFINKTTVKKNITNI